MGIPWYIWASLAAITSSMVGVHWDISWHQSIGRDSFLTAPHVAIYLSGILGGFSAAFLILSTTFSAAAPLREKSVRMWGFRGPVGAFLMAWGALCMIVSAPFDNWWHDAYGLDVKILSPPHVILAVGIFGIQIGVLLLVQAFMNRAEPSQRDRYLPLCIYASGMLLIGLMVFQMELTSRVAMHTVYFYRVLALTVPLILPRVSRSTSYKWAATATAGVYTVFVLLMGHILPLFPAEPKLGPVYQHVTQFVPPPFPLLLIVPAFVLDWMWQRTAHWPRWRQSIVSAIVFLVALAAVQWPFADFLMSPAARNWWFGAKYFAYFQRPGGLYFNYQFIPLETGGGFWEECAMALVFASLTTWFGFANGEWMRRIRR